MSAVEGEPTAARIARITRRFAAPLRAYIDASMLAARLDDADGLVTAFLDDFAAARVDPALNLDRWRESGLPLRRWLVQAFLVFAREREQQLRRAAEAAAKPASSPCVGCACGSAAACGGGGAIGLEPGAFEEFERAWSRTLLSEAGARLRRELAGEDDLNAWEAFQRHHFGRAEFAEIARELGITAAEARARARRAAPRFEAALVDLVREELAAPRRGGDPGVEEARNDQEARNDEEAPGDREALEAEMAWFFEVSGR